MQAEKEHLIRLLDAARYHTRAVLQHEEALRAVTARQTGASYTIPDFQTYDAYNQADFERRRAVLFDRLLADLESVREQLMAFHEDEHITQIEQAT